MKDQMLFLAWAPPSHSGRSQLLSAKLGIELLPIHYLGMQVPALAPAKYVLEAARTSWELVRRRPRIVFVQNPPIFASAVAWLYCACSRAGLIIDSHTDALQASWWKWSLPLHRLLSRRAICTFVTNEHLFNTVQSWGARPFVLADVPTVFNYRPCTLDGAFNIAMVSSFAYDEPRGIVFEVARRLPDVRFHITGNSALANPSELRRAPPNVHFTGFLAPEAYYGLLAAADAVLVLTTQDHTLQWGACEAVSLGKPIITSNWPFLKAYFNKGTLYVDNSADSLYQAIGEMKREREQLAREIEELREERQTEWACKHAELMRIIRQAIPD